MKSTTLLGALTAAVFISATSLALAQGTQPKAQHQDKAQQDKAQQEKAQQEKAQQEKAQQEQHQAQSVGQEQIEGRIVAVDKNKGTVSVQTAQHGQLEFKLTPAQVQKLNEGEQLRLQIQIHSMPKQP